MFYNDTDHIIQIGLNETLVETLIDVVPPVIVTALIFVLARVYIGWRATTRRRGSR